MTSTTRFQTAEVVFPISNLIFHTILEKPVAPLVESNDPVGIKTVDGKYIVFNPDGSVYVKEPDGRSAYFEPAPTLADAVASATTANFYQFHPDKSITCRINGQTYYYSPPFEGKPVEGTRLEYRWDDTQGWLFEGIDFECESDDDDGYWSDDGMPRYARGSWRNMLTPEQKEEWEIKEAAASRKVFKEHFKSIWEESAAKGNQGAADILKNFEEREKRELEREREYEAKKAATCIE